ncbi:hypothetical protein BDQ12DRAFT_728529 [Crucibulum laeve]|uniref:Uncharacterized protein n=1 Tax=Crucibulum laeve TaxID=68775 RepID=A0A5C3LV43_9AGAR|nr:hypothetical protein BDQ12DRAFT_728529 [Crucibulum laeve]
MSNQGYYGTPVEKPGPAYYSGNGHHGHQGGQPQPQYYQSQPQAHHYQSQPQAHQQPQVVYVQGPQRKDDDSSCLPCACLTGICAGLFCCPCFLCC